MNLRPRFFHEVPPQDVRRLIQEQHAEGYVLDMLAEHRGTGVGKQNFWAVFQPGVADTVVSAASTSPTALSVMSSFQKED